jgi:hypothetical protein
MPLSDDTERALQAIAQDVRRQVVDLGVEEDAALRRLVTLLRAPGKEADRERIRDRARMIAAQGGRCAVCFVAFADSPPATRSMVTGRLLCKPCARESKAPPPPPPR